MPNEYRRTVVQLVENHDATLYPSLPSARRWLLRLGEEQLRRLMKMQECDAAAHVASVHKKRFLRSLLEDVVEGKLKNEKEALLSAAAE